MHKDRRRRPVCGTKLRVTLSNSDLFERTSQGILAFPATAFDPEFGLDVERTAGEMERIAREKPAALVVAGGAGEIFSIDAAEHAIVIDAAVRNAGEVAVIAGVGCGVAAATAMARTAERLGADGILLFPPYLTRADQDGLAAYVSAVCQQVGIGVIAYSRDNGVLSAETALRLAARHANFLGIKDGVGDFDTLLKLKLHGGDRLLVVNGVPTAEIIAAQCFAAGIRSYSSAVFTFLPSVAKRFYAAVNENDKPMADMLMRDFYLPLVDIRRRHAGYAVSIIKAGLRLVGLSAGPVRAPLVDLSKDDMSALDRLVHRALEIVAA